MNEVEGLRETLRGFDKIPAALVENQIEALSKGADEVVAMMKRLAPKGETGALAESIAWTWGDPPKGALAIATVGGGEQFGRLRISIFAGGTPGTQREQLRGSGRDGSFITDNAVFQEFGTINMAANPFFFPSWRALKKRVRARLTREARKTIKKLGT